MSERQMGFRRIWSPYYCLRLTRYSADHTNITIGNSFIMSALNIYGSGEETGKIAEYYEMPYRCGKTIREVLILGAGMGNDIAAALHNGAVHVDAVEIDPRIVALGRSCHPLKPYDDPRVTVIINDARSWTKQTKGKYDLIVFATLDSHGLFSQLSSLKMENYVYTRESFEEAKALLEEDGLLYVNTGFYGTVFVNHRIYQCLRQVFGKEPRYFLACDSILMYLTSKGEIPDADFSRYRFKRLSVDEGRLRRDSPGAFILPTDDWPHLFLAEKRIPREYLFALAVLLAVSALFVRLSFGPARAFDFNYFFLGAGFMLLETKSITEMGLVFGATWLVNSVVITSVLLIILAVNITLLKIDRFNNIYIPYALLGLCLASAYLTPLGALNIESLPIKIILASAYIGIPVGLASVIFALNFRTAGEQAVPCLGSNMIGAVFGGIAEYFSMVWGLKSLHLLAAGFYLAAMAAMMLQRRRAS
jgi:SAM-dependent methyltransferase